MWYQFFTRHDRSHLLFVMTWWKVTKKASPKVSGSQSSSTNTERQWFRIVRRTLRAPWKPSYGFVVTIQWASTINWKIIVTHCHSLKNWCRNWEVDSGTPRLTWQMPTTRSIWHWSESQRRLALSTHRWVLLQQRLPFGIKSEPGYFQEIIENLTSDLRRVAVFQDDMLVSGQNASDH